MNAANHRSLWLVVGVLICILLLGALIVSAQSTPLSISIGENQTASLTDASSPCSVLNCRTYAAERQRAGLGDFAGVCARLPRARSQQRGQSSTLPIPAHRASSSRR